MEPKSGHLGCVQQKEYANVGTNRQVFACAKVKLAFLAVMQCAL